MAREVTHRAHGSGKLLLGGWLNIALTILCGAASPQRLIAQTPQAVSGPSPSFDVASIKPSKSEGQDDTEEDDRNQRIKSLYEGAPLIECMGNAYGVKDYQIIGPKWIKLQRYDINAVGANPTNDRMARLLMLQNLLADRFQVKLHREVRTLPMLELTVLKKGPRIGEPKPGSGSSISGNNAGTTFKGASMADLAGSLIRITGLPVVDKTGLTARYDFDLRYSRESQSGVPESSGESGANDTSAPSIFTALQEQLGLKLKAVKGPVEVLVIDHVEQPSAN
jgi:uncharacterized protein (TIGR03435 family)